MTNDVVRATARLIALNELMTIATADELGKPWISTVAYSFDENGCFYWVSDKDTQHSCNIRTRPEVALSILATGNDGEMDGVFIDAHAQELVEADIELGIKMVSQRNQPRKFRINSPDDVTGTAAWRIYRAKPVAIFKRDDGMHNGQAVTVRVDIEIDELQRCLNAIDG